MQGSRDELQRVKFRQLCDALLRNDPTVATTRISDKELFGFLRYGVDFETALYENRVVSEFDFNFDYFSTRYFRTGDRRRSVETNTPRHGVGNTDPGTAAAKAEAFLRNWILHSPALTTVKLTSWNQLFDDGPVQRLLQATAHNARIQTVETYLPFVPLSMLTEFLTQRANNGDSAALPLQSFSMTVNDNASDDELQAAAQVLVTTMTVQKLPVLKLTANRLEHFLQHFLAFSPSSLSPTACLQELTLGARPGFRTSGCTMQSTAALLGRLLECCTELRSLELQALDINSPCWSLLFAGLQANVSIATLKLDECRIVGHAARRLYMEDLKSPSSLHQHVRRLELTRSNDFFFDDDVDMDMMVEDDDPDVINENGKPARIVSMLNGSLLQHISLDGRLFGWRDQSHFFTLLTDQTNAIQLHSIKLIGMRPDILGHAARYIPSTVHLQDLEIEIDTNDLNLDAPDILHITDFVSSVRGNGSLHNVNITYNPLVRTDPLDTVVRNKIAAYTTRNRILSELLKSSICRTSRTTPSHAIVDSGESAAAATLAASTTAVGAGTATENLFGTLCRASQHAPRMAPNTVLTSLLAASEALTLIADDPSE